MDREEEEEKEDRNGNGAHWGEVKEGSEGG